MVKLGGVLALAFMIVASGSVAGISTLQSYDTGTEFQNNAGSDSTSVRYDSVGVEIDEAGVYTTSLSLSESPDTVKVVVSDYNGSDFQIGVEDGNQNVVNSITKSSTGTYTVDISSYDGTNPLIAITNPDNGDTTTGQLVSIDSISVTTNEAPAADLTDDDNEVTVGVDESYTIDASSTSDPEGDSLTFDWDTDGDGNFDDASGSTVTVSESNTGTYEYDVQVSDGNGNTDTATMVVNVSDSAGGGSGFTGDGISLTDPIVLVIGGAFVVMLGFLAVKD